MGVFENFVVYPGRFRNYLCELSPVFLLFRRLMHVTNCSPLIKPNPNHATNGNDDYSHCAPKLVIINPNPKQPIYLVIACTRQTLVGMHSGQCNFMLLFIMSTAAIACTLASTSYCNFMQRNVKLAEGTDIDALCSNYTDFINCNDLLKVRDSTYRADDAHTNKTTIKAEPKLTLIFFVRFVSLH